MLNKYMLVLFVSVFAITATYAQSEKSSGPKLSIVGSSVIDAGNIYNTGAKVEKTFQIRNSGDKTLHISQVKTSCGCTVASLADSVLAPGQAVDLKVDFNPMEYSGDVAKSIYVFSDDPANNMTTLELKMHISFALKAQPNFILFRDSKVGIQDSVAVILTNTSDEPFQITGVETESDRITGRVDSTSIKPGESVAAEIYLLSKEAGPVFGNVLIKTTSKLQSVLPIRYYASVR